MALTPKREAFVAYYCGEAKQNASEAARLAGYAKPGQEGHFLLKNPEIARAIEAFRAEIKSQGIASLQNRIDSYADDFRLTERVIAARALAYAAAPGGDTGLLVGRLKTVKYTYDKDPDDPDAKASQRVEEVWEYEADTALMNERLKLRKQIAQEKGEWTEQTNLTGDPLTTRVEIVLPPSATEEPPDGG